MRWWTWIFRDPRRRRFFVALAIAPFVALFCIGLSMMVDTYKATHRWSRVLGDIPGFVFFGSVLLVMTYVPTLFIGLPIFRYFLLRSWTRWWQVTLGGFVAGVTAAVFVGLTPGAMGAVVLVIMLPAFTMVGTLAAFIFWLISFRAGISAGAVAPLGS